MGLSRDRKKLESKRVSSRRWWIELLETYQGLLKSLSRFSEPLQTRVGDNSILSGLHISSVQPKIKLIESSPTGSNHVRILGFRIGIVMMRHTEEKLSLEGKRLNKNGVKHRLK